MGTRYPSYSQTEYAPINETAVVDYALKLAEIDRTVKENELTLRDAIDAANSRGGKFLDALCEEIKTFAATRPRAPVKPLIDRYRRTRHLQLPPSADSPRTTLMTEVRFQFSTFEEEAFREWYRERYADEFSTDWMKLKQSAQGTLQSAHDKRKRLLVEAAKAIFKDGVPPKKFRDRTPDDGFAEFVITTFVKDYRERASLFSEPVTITGMSIYSLPTSEERRVWSDAYKALGLDRIRKNPTYLAIKSA